MARRSNGYTRVRDLKRRKGSSTPGIQKVESCWKKGWKNLYCSSRGYKHPNYPKWCEKIDNMQK